MDRSPPAPGPRACAACPVKRHKCLFCQPDFFSKLIYFLYFSCILNRGLSPFGVGGAFAGEDHC
ncbi:MAG: hypothetical protein CMO29_24245 [Tistrella sp.]|nr:hypothetical protein [Tistrella sp.]